MRGESGTAAAGRVKPGTSTAASQGEVGGSGMDAGKRQEVLRESTKKRQESATEKQRKSGKNSLRKAAEKRPNSGEKSR
ncbi:hypothetical protein TURU_015430 [Turdus rufiventris]|nr:hypothetical protein TURU_015430 [Turdus rufiventris]